MRWKLIPTLILASFGGIVLLGGIVMLSLTVYINSYYGPSVVNSIRSEFFDGMALTVRNTSMIVSQLVVGSVTLYTSRQWWLERYRLAIILTVIVWIGMGALASQMDPRKTRKGNRKNKKESQPVAVSVQLGSISN
ncbi:MAG: hypothetical protein JWN70_2423 [Planctomycetaceae bacterium]|nr:hypothetical protein [Planctomycetaceae bacterium]